MNYIAPADHTGYGCAAAAYIQLLRDAGVRVLFQPLQAGTGLGLWYECAPSKEALDPDAVTVLHTVPEYYVPLTEWLHRQGLRGPVVGMTVWETSHIPAHWPALLNDLDVLIVPSAWNRQVFYDCGVRVPIFEVPHASQFDGMPADETAVQPLRSRLPDLGDKFVFYSIGAWSHRKGNDLLIRAFQKAFVGREDIRLVLKTSATSFDPQRPRWKRALRRLAGLRDLHQELLLGKVPGVTILTDHLSDEEMRALHTIGDCYVCCTRGEGWGLGLYEAILFEKPVLAPREGGHREYLRADEFAGFLPGKRTAVRTPGRDDSYRPNQEWFEVDVAQTALKMGRVAENPSELRRAVELVSKEIRCSLSREKILTDFLAAITGALAGPRQESSLQ